MVSCILPTRGRQEWAKQALDCFLSQTYPDKELLIYDDLEDPSFPKGIPPGYKIMRFMNMCRLIPKKRNDLCNLSNGHYIAHFDSDDWSAPDRLAEQIERLEMSGKALTGYYSMLFWNGEQAYQYRNGPHEAIGSSFCFLKSWWKDHRFPETEVHKGVVRDRTICEDNEFSREAFRAGQLLSVEGGQMMVARIHPGNTAPKHVEGCTWRMCSTGSIPEAFPL